MFKLLFTLLACLITFSPAYADDTSKTPVENQKAMTKDADAMAIVIALDNNEVTLAKAVKDKLTTQPLKDFAEMMITDHGKNAEETMKLSEEINIKPNDTDRKAMMIKKDGEKALKKLTAMSGEKLDKAYVHDMVVGHKKALKEVEALEKSASNPSLVKHLNDTEASIKHHLEAAEALNKTMK